jgi:PAS domain S-box-containing protein
MWISDATGTLIRINKACADLLNISADEVIGRYNILTDNIVKEQGHLPLVERVFERGETARFEISYDSAALKHLALSRHARVILDVTVFPIRDPRGRVTNAVIQHNDITVRREAEQTLQLANLELEARVAERTRGLTAANAALRESEALFRTLCAAAPIGIFMSDVCGDCIYSNPRLQELSGLDGDALLGTGWVAALHPEDAAGVTARWSEAAAAGNTYRDEFRLHSAGTPTWVRVLAQPFPGADGNFAGYVGVVEDVTEQRYVREELLKTQKLESLGVLAGGIAHDFNNILSIILGYISLARSNAHDPEQVVSRLKDSERGVLRARDLTQQLLTFARGGEPVKRIVKLNELLREAAQFGSLGSNVRCEFLLAPEALLVSADEGQLSQVVHNLVINAVQAMPEGGVLTIGSAHCRSAEGEARVCFSVRDTGVGIAEELKVKVFDPYFTTKKGSGLGLTSCYSIVRRHGGTLSVESAPGAGSCFTVSLPAFVRHLEAAPAPAPVENLGCGRILVMDDDPLIQEVAQAMLEQLGYRADCVSDGAAAIGLYRSHLEQGDPYAAVIMDLTVRGGIGGKEAIKSLLDLDPGVQAIVSSGYSDDPVLANCLAYGFRSVLTKPYNKQELSEVLHNLLAS